jgi:hypothetical protein
MNWAQRSIEMRVKQNFGGKDFILELGFIGF